MKFLIERDALSGNQKYKPIEGCHQERYTRVETRTLTSEDEFDNKFGKSEGTWRSKGKNHRDSGAPDYYIVRDHLDELTGWFREIASLDELIDIADTWGDVVITRAYSNSDIRLLEIRG